MGMTVPRVAPGPSPTAHRSLLTAPAMLYNCPPLGGGGGSPICQEPPQMPSGQWVAGGAARSGVGRRLRPSATPSSPSRLVRAYRRDFTELLLLVVYWTCSWW